MQSVESKEKREEAQKRKTGEWDPRKPEQRIAHVASTASRFAPIPISNCAVPSAKRYHTLNSLLKAARDLYLTNEQLAKQVAIEQEYKIVKRCKHKSNYANLSATIIKRFRAAKPGQPGAKEFAPQFDLSKLPPGTTHHDLLINEKLGQSVLKKQNTVARLTGATLHKALQPYIMTSEQIKINNYPIPTAKNKKVVTINDTSRFKQKITEHATKRICTRCGKEFFLTEDAPFVTGGECAYHAGRLYPDRTSHHYSCCKGPAGSDPCKYHDTHVHEENKNDFTGYSSTASMERVHACDKTRTEPLVFAID